MANDHLKTSVESLKKVYAVIIALAIGRALQLIFNEETWGQVNNNLIMYAPILISFFLFIIPFYHGMDRHLETCYYDITNIEQDKRVSLLLDFFTFFIESSLLFALASTIQLGEKCYIFFVAIMVIDIIWALVSNLINYASVKPGILPWAAINFATLVIGLFLFSVRHIFPMGILWPLCVLSLCRTLLDYWFMRNFYFPPPKATEKTEQIG